VFDISLWTYPRTFLSENSLAIYLLFVQNVGHLPLRSHPHIDALWVTVCALEIFSLTYLLTHLLFYILICLEPWWPWSLTFDDLLISKWHGMAIYVKFRKCLKQHWQSTMLYHYTPSIIEDRIIHCVSMSACPSHHATYTLYSLYTTF